MAIRRAPQSGDEEAEQASQEPTPRLFTVDEYYKMAEVGILGPNERVQLIEGIIFQMPAIGPRHAYNVNRLTRMFWMRLGDRGDVRNQSPVRLANRAEPEPDIAVVTAYPDDPKTYESRHPTTEETLLVVEIADSTLTFDLGEKARMYSRRGLRELWVVDLQGHRLVVHREPTPDGYANVRTLSRDETIVPLAFPDITCTVDEILG